MLILQEFSKNLHKTRQSKLLQISSECQGIGPFKRVCRCLSFLSVGWLFLRFLASAPVFSVEVTTSADIIKVLILNDSRLKISVRSIGQSIYEKLPDGPAPQVLIVESADYGPEYYKVKISRVQKGSQVLPLLQKLACRTRSSSVTLTMLPVETQLTSQTAICACRFRHGMMIS